MKMNSSLILFSATLMIGSIITISSNSWFGVWMGLEMNLLSFIPLMSQSSKFSAEAALKYFLVQAMASAILLIGILMLYLNMSNIIFESGLANQLIALAALTKMGAAPLYQWFPEVSNGLDWLSNMILMTWQKIAPFILLFYIHVPANLIILIAGASALVGAFGGFNQISLRKILAYSSINHMAWMIIGASASQTLWLTYFITYSVMTLTMMMYFYMNSFNLLSQLMMSPLSHSLGMFLMSLNMLSMGGLPPFLGFLPKWMVMEFMINQELYALALFMVMMTLIVLYFYLRLTYSSFMYYSSSLKMTAPVNLNLNIFLLWVSVVGLLIGPILIFV